MITKFIKNITGSNLQVLNRDLEPTEIWEIPVNLWAELYEDSKIVSDLTAGFVEISTDGITALSFDAAVKLIQQFQEDSAGFGQRFVINDVNIKSNEEMIISDITEITVTGCLDIEGMLTILGE